MDSTPPPRSHQKSASRLSNLHHHTQQKLSLEIVPSSSPKVSTPSPASTVSPRPPYTLPLKDLLMLSPSPVRKSKVRPAYAADETAAIEASGVRKRCKTRNSAAASPRGGRRSLSRRKLEQEPGDERDFVAAGGEVLIKPRKKRHGERSRTGRSIMNPPPVPSPRTGDDYGHNLDAIGESIHDLIMWKDVSKSSLWFGFGSISFLSSCFVKGVNFSIYSFLSQVGLLFLGLSFFSNSMRQRDISNKPDLKLKEEDIVRVGRLILPAANLAISKARQIFSGEPATTLKVVPVFLLGAEYGHFISLWRLCALGFFISFLGPKLYSTYSSQLSGKVEYIKLRVRDAWENCAHKRIVAGSAVTAFWNLTSIRTRIFTAFVCVVIVRYRRQHLGVMLTGVEKDGCNNNTAELILKQEDGEEEKETERALIVVESESKK